MFGWLKNLMYNWGNGPARTADAVNKVTFNGILLIGFMLFIAYVLFRTYQKVENKKRLNEKDERIKELELEKEKMKIEAESKILQEAKERELKQLLETQNKLLAAINRNDKKPTTKTTK